MNTPLISIIIPTYNRAHLIGETLDSIIIQTYSNLECIVVDDGSYDYTEELMEFYSQKDPRIQFHHRPESRKKGANACRNYGFKISKGDYINWFDSDDLMTADFVGIKLKGIQSGNYDFCITKTKYFNLEIQDEFYTYKSEDISNHNYITQKVNWLTCDAFIKRTVAEKISFNPNLQSGQEFNYFAKLTSINSRATLIDSYVSLRRYHENSIRGPLRNNNDKLLRSRYKSHWATYKDLKEVLNKDSRKYLIRKCIGFFFYFKQYYKSFSLDFFVAIWRELGLKKAIYYCLANITNSLTGKGYFFVKRTRHL